MKKYYQKPAIRPIDVSSESLLAGSLPSDITTPGIGPGASSARALQDLEMLQDFQSQQEDIVNSILKLNNQ